MISNALSWVRRWAEPVFLFASVLALYGATCALRLGGEWGSLVGVALVAWPLWQFQVERMHVARRAYLAELTTPQGFIRRWFWRGSFSAAWQAVLALGGGLLLLLLVTSLRPMHWLLLLADATLLFLLLKLVQRALRSQIQPQYRRAIARYWLFWMNVVLLAVAFAALEYYHYGMPDNRDVPWRQLALQTFDGSLQDYGASTFGGLIAVAATVEQLVRHAAMLYVPSLPEPLTRSAVWFGLAIFLGTGSWLLTRFFLGTIAIVDALGFSRSTEKSPDSDSQDVALPVFRSHSAWPYEYLVVLLASTVALVSFGSSIREISQGPWLRKAVGVVAVATDPCANTKFITEKSRAAFDTRISSAERQSIDHAKAVIKTSLDATFNEAKRGVDPFLDWYFSVAGDAARFISMVKNKYKDQLAEEIQAKVLPPLVGLDKSLPETVSANLRPIFGGALKKVQEDLSSQIDEQPCLRFELNLPELSVAKDKTRWTLSLAIATAFSTTIAQRVATSSAVNLAERAGIRAAGTSAVKALERQSGKWFRRLAVGRVLCNFSGWLKWLCRGAIATATEVFTLKLDDVLHRDEMRKKLIADLDEQRVMLEEDLGKQAERVIRSQVITLRADVNQKVFVPARDGV